MRTIGFYLMIFLSLAPSVYGAEGIFTPSIGIGAEYTDNVYLTHDQKESDVILFASPRFNWDLSGEKNTMNLFFSPTFRNYVKGTEENVTLYDASLTFSAPVTRDTVFTASDLFFLTDDPAVDIADMTIRKTRETYYKNTTNIGLNSQFGPFDSTYIQCAYVILRNDDPALMDSDEFTPSAGMTYRFLPEWVLAVNASYTLGEFFRKSDQEASSDADDFDNIKTSLKVSKQLTHFVDAFVQYAHILMRYKGVTEDYDIMEPSVGVGVKTDDGPIFSIQIGYFVLNRHEREDEDGLTISGNLGQNFRFRKGSFSLMGSSGYAESYFGAENLGFSVYHQAVVTFIYELSQNLRYEITCQARNDDYRNLLYKRIDTTQQVKTGINYGLRAWINIKLSYEYTNVDINEATIVDQAVDQDYAENRFILEAFFAPAGWGKQRSSRSSETELDGNGN